MRYRPFGYTLPLTTCANCTACGISDFLKIPSCTSLVVRMSFTGASLPPVYSELLGTCYRDNSSAIMCSSDGLTPPSVDPLMLLDFAKAFTISVVYPALLIISVVCGGIAVLVTMLLFHPLLFNWRHARNLHVGCIVASLGSAFFLLLTGLMTTSGVSGAMVALRTVSLQVIEAERGIVLEACVWSAFALWVLIFLWAWWVRWWEILERRDAKQRMVKLDTERRKKQEEEKKARDANKDNRMKADEAFLASLAAAQM